VAFLRRGGDHAHLADAGDRHLERPRNRGGRHGEHVDVEAHLLQRLLVLDAEALFLVHDHQAEILELDLLGEQTMRPDDDVDGTIGQAVDDLLRLGRGLEPAQRGDRHRESGVAIGEGGVVLLHQQGRWHQDGDLLAVHDRLERGAHRDLGLAVADVAADEAVHRDDLLHVALDLDDRRQLVGGLHVGEVVFEFALPRAVDAERVPLGGLPGRIQLDEFGGDLPDGLAGPALALVPVGSAHPVQRRGLPAHVAGDLIEGVHGDEQPVPRLTPLGGAYSMTRYSRVAPATVRVTIST